MENPVAAPADNSFADLFDDVGIEHRTGESCPSCRASLPDGAVLCIHCGFNVALGQKTRTNIASSDGSAGGSAPESIASSLTSDGHDGSETAALLAKAEMSEDPDEDMDDHERYGSMITAWIVGAIMVACLAGALYGVYYYNVIYLPANTVEEVEDEFN